MVGFYYYDEINKKKFNKIEFLKCWVFICVYVNKLIIVYDFVIN